MIWKLKSHQNYLKWKDKLVSAHKNKCCKTTWFRSVWTTWSNSFKNPKWRQRMIVLGSRHSLWGNRKWGSRPVLNSWPGQVRLHLRVLLIKLMKLLRQSKMQLKTSRSGMTRLRSRLGKSWDTVRKFCLLKRANLQLKGQNLLCPIWSDEISAHVFFWFFIYTLKKFYGSNKEIKKKWRESRRSCQFVRIISRHQSSS